MTIDEAAKRIRFHLPPIEAAHLVERVQQRVQPDAPGDAFLRALRDEMVEARIIRPDEWVVA